MTIGYLIFDLLSCHISSLYVSHNLNILNRNTSTGIKSSGVKSTTGKYKSTYNMSTDRTRVVCGVMYFSGIETRLPYGDVPLLQG
jgi:hypothetical protein